MIVMLNQWCVKASNKGANVATLCYQYCPVTMVCRLHILVNIQSCHFDVAITVPIIRYVNDKNKSVQTCLQK